MAVFSVQAQNATATLSFADKAQRTTYTTSQQVWEQNGITFTNNKSNSTTNVADYAAPARFYKNSEIIVKCSLGNITQIVFTCNSSSYASALGTSISGSTVSGSNVTVALDGTSNSYTISSLTGGQVRMDEVAVTYTTTGGEGGDTPDPVDVAEPTFTPADGETFEESLDVTINAEEGLTVYYSTDNKVSYTEGNNVNITETTTVYAYAEDAEGNQSNVVEATYTKADPNAITKTIVASETGIDNGVAVETLKFGNVTATFDKGDNSNATKYYASGTAFRAYGGNTITFTGDAGVTINSVVFEFGSSDGSNAITADCGTYSEGTWTGASNQVVFTIGGTSGNRRLKTITVTYSVDENVVVISTPSIAGEETFLGSTTVEITNNAEGTTLYYSTDGVNYNEYTGALTIDATTTVYAYAQDGEGNKSSVADATFTEMEILSIADAKAAYDAAGTNVDVAVDITDAVVTVNNGQYMFIETAEAGINIYNSGADYAVGTKFTTGYILGVSAVYGKMHQITNAEFCDVATETVEVTPKDVTIAELNADFDAYEGRYVRLTGVNINDKTITQGEDTYALYNRFDFITAPTVAANCDIVAVVARYNTTYQVFPVSISNTVDVTAAGYATLYLGYPVAIPAGVEAYVVSAVNDGWVALEQVTGVLPAETGVIVKAGQGEYEFVYSADEAATISSLLKGTVAAENVTPAGTAYVLSAPAGVVGLYIAELAEGAFLNNANKAYLDVTSSDAIASYSFNFDWNGTTGIEGVVAEGAQDGAIYDITGRRVKAITAPGIYIVNGRKVVK